tara:strand:- start:113 stop:646 length:534 start_codon:yes stop_codon:yes gene_type:complete
MITKSIKLKIKHYFFDNPTKQLRVRHIEKEVKVPLPSAIRYAKELKDEKFLKTSEIAKIITYSADRNSKEFIFEKKLYNIKKLYDYGLIQFINDELSNPAIILFGSYFRGEDVEISDVDLYIETLSKKKLNLDKFEKILKRDIQIFQHKSIKNIKNKELVNNILNGVTLNGFVEVFK